jgi:hypothetical protein
MQPQRTQKDEDGIAIARRDTQKPSARHLAGGRATGKNRLCSDYDVTQQSCRVWAYTVHHSAPKKKSVPSGETSHTAASPRPGTRRGGNRKEGKVTMKKLLMSVAFITVVGSIVPADAASTLAIGGGLNLGHVQTGTGANSTGTAAAGSLANGTTTNIGAGFAAASPAGSLSTGLGASVGQSNAVSGAASIGNGAATTSGVSNNIGVGVGGGFTNVLP